MHSYPYCLCEMHISLTGVLVSEVLTDELSDSLLLILPNSALHDGERCPVSCRHSQAIVRQEDPRLYERFWMVHLGCVLQPGVCARCAALPKSY